MMRSQVLSATRPILRAPFPWFGGKSLAADLVWRYLGADIGNYVEPFFGSGAILLNQPEEFSGWSVVNDLDGLIANFWRAIAADPESVAFYADSQVNEIDLQARHQWLVDNKRNVAESLKADPDYFDARVAGWWAWGCSCWIGSGWCSDKKIPHLGDGGQGDRAIFLTEWFERIQSKLRNARVTCGDWQRICTASTMTRNGICGVVLDPPYGTTKAVYAEDSQTVADDVLNWCKANGANPLLRIALCGHAGQHEALEAMGWVVESPKKGGGYQGADDRERIWFSPHCVKQNRSPQLSLFDLAV